LQRTTWGGSRSDAVSRSASEPSLGSSVLSSFFLATRLLALSLSNGFPDTTALSNFLTSSSVAKRALFQHSPVDSSKEERAPSSCASSRRTRIIRACSKLMRPSIPRSLSMLRICAICALVDRPLSSRVHCFRTPQATTSDWGGQMSKRLIECS
jgi:hypothetical protein